MGNELESVATAKSCHELRTKKTVYEGCTVDLFNFNQLYSKSVNNITTLTR
jgi:hypothetical protein